MTKHATLLSTAPEVAYLSSVPERHRKQLAQFFTPSPIATFMATWITDNPACRTILDPAVGMGMLLRAVLQQPHADTYQLRGFDVDPLILEHVRVVFAQSDDTNVELLHKDYIFDDWDAKYDGIICNPPYLKFQQYKQRAASLQEVQDRLEITLSGLSNIYTMFLLKSIHQLAAGGRAAYIVPLEFLNADYGTIIKQQLLKSRTLRYIIIFNSDQHVFDNALTTSCILLLARDDRAESVTFLDATSVNDLAAIATQLGSPPKLNVTGTSVPAADLDPAVKWRSYYQKRNWPIYKNLVPLATYGKIVRGIATGNNEYFTFDQAKIDQFALPASCLLPCITKSNQADTNFFTAEDFEKLRRRGKRVFLFNATEPSDPAVQAYIALGEQRGVNRGYLTSHRKPWFATEHRPPAPILVMVFNRNGLRFVRNEARLSNLTCFHSFYVNMGAPHQQDMLMAYLLTQVSSDIFNEDQREYGGGLKKFEPNDLNRAKAIDLAMIDPYSGNRILALYQRYRASVVEQRPDRRLLEQLNDLFFHLLRR